MLPTRDPPHDKRPTQTESERLETNFPSKWRGEKSRDSKTHTRQKKSKRIHLHQTSSARDANGAALRKGRKRVRERGTQVGKNVKE